MDIFRLFDAIQASSIVPHRFRSKIRTRMGIHIDETARLRDGNHFTTGNVSIGPHAYVNFGCLFDGPERITLHELVHVGPRVQFLTTTHEMGTLSKRAGTVRNEPITVERGCWIGAGSIILPGVIIREGCVVGAGSVVTKNTEPSGVYIGIPARRVRDINDSVE